MSLREGLSSAAALARIASVKGKAKSESRKSPVRGLMSISLSLRSERRRRPEVAARHRRISVRHCGRRRCPVPMLQARRKPDDIAGPDFLDRSAIGLDPAEPRCDDQRLTKRMRVPRAARARLERDMSAGDARRIARLEQRVDAHWASEVIRRSLGGRPRAASCDLHLFHSLLESGHSTPARRQRLLPGQRSPRCRRECVCV